SIPSTIAAATVAEGNPCERGAENGLPALRPIAWAAGTCTVFFMVFMFAQDSTPNPSSTLRFCGLSPTFDGLQLLLSRIRNSTWALRFSPIVRRILPHQGWAHGSTCLKGSLAVIETRRNPR